VLPYGYHASPRTSHDNGVYEEPMALSVRNAAITSGLIIGVGTTYSIAYSTFIDTSNPLLQHLPHPLQGTHFFANKANPLNVIFLKRLWFWTTLSFAGLLSTSPQYAQTWGRMYKYGMGTFTWAIFCNWFFGPPILDRFISFTGGECCVTLPTGYVMSVPARYCQPGENKFISPGTHPFLFAASLIIPDTGRWKARPRMRKGHDISGHIFLLTMSCLFLVDQLVEARRTRIQGSDLQRYVFYAVSSVIGLELFAMYITSVYFHTAEEKLSGFGELPLQSTWTQLTEVIQVLGLAGYLLMKLPFLEDSTPLENVEVLGKETNEVAGRDHVVAAATKDRVNVKSE
jgi:hypothetical protein